jgi:hypothetical protein
VRCQLLFVRDERPGVLVLDCIVADGTDGLRGVPCALEVASPGRSLGDQLALASIRRWAATGVISELHLRRTDSGGVRAEARSADGAIVSVEPLRVVGLRAVGDLY